MEFTEHGILDDASGDHAFRDLIDFGEQLQSRLAFGAHSDVQIGFGQAH
jgi:hypothetical protein